MVAILDTRTDALTTLNKRKLIRTRDIESSIIYRGSSHHCCLWYEIAHFGKVLLCIRKTQMFRCLTHFKISVDKHMINFLFLLRCVVEEFLNIPLVVAYMDITKKVYQCVHYI